MTSASRELWTRVFGLGSYSRTGQLGQGSNQPGQDSWYRKAWTGQPGQDTWDRTAIKGKLGNENWDRKLRKTDGIEHPG
jgi:hypothetical protein